MKICISIRYSFVTVHKEASNNFKFHVDTGCWRLLVWASPTNAPDCFRWGVQRAVDPTVADGRPPSSRLSATCWRRGWPTAALRGWPTVDPTVADQWESSLIITGTIHLPVSPNGAFSLCNPPIPDIDCAVRFDELETDVTHNTPVSSHPPPPPILLLTRRDRRNS